MKRFTTFICSIAFACFGLCLALSGDPPSINNDMTVMAATPNLQLVSMPGESQFSSFSVNKSDTTITKADTVYIAKQEPVKLGKPAKRPRNRAPDRIVYKVKHDTTFVEKPVYYLMTQTQDGNGSHYELKKVENLPKTGNCVCEHNECIYD